MLPEAIVAVWFAFILIAEPIEHASHHRLVVRSDSIHVGMTPDEVESVLGVPAARYTKRRPLS